MADYRITVELQEPFTCGTRPVVSNEIATLDRIPGTNLRGALASALVRSGRGSELGAWFGDPGPRYTPAFRADSIPIPLSFIHKKATTISACMAC